MKPLDETTVKFLTPGVKLKCIVKGEKYSLQTNKTYTFNNISGIINDITVICVMEGNKKLGPYFAYRFTLDLE
jgi:hypothetical protein